MEQIKSLATIKTFVSFEENTKTLNNVLFSHWNEDNLTNVVL